MAFGRQRELEAEISQLRERLRLTEEGWDRAVKELAKAGAEIRRLDPPPPTTRELAKAALNEYLDAEEPTHGLQYQANLAYAILYKKSL